MGSRSTRSCDLALIHGTDDAVRPCGGKSAKIPISPFDLSSSMAERPQRLLHFARHGATAAEDPVEAGQGVAEPGPDVRVAESVRGDPGGPPQGGRERSAQPGRPEGIAELHAT